MNSLPEWIRPWHAFHCVTTCGSFLLFELARNRMRSHGAVPSLSMVPNNDVVLYGVLSQSWYGSYYHSLNVPPHQSVDNQIQMPFYPHGIHFYSWVERSHYGHMSFSRTQPPQVSWPSGLVHWTHVLALSECGFKSQPGRSRRLCPWARHLTIIASSFRWDVKLYVPCVV